MRGRPTSWHARLLGVVAAVTGLAMGACAGGTGAAPARPTPPADPPRVLLTPAPNVPGDPANGRGLFVSAGCGGCHTLTGVSTATGVSGPVLTNVVLRPTLAGDSIPMTPESLTRWLISPAALKPGTPMPNVGLTEEQARDIAAYLYSQPHNPGG